MKPVTRRKHRGVSLIEALVAVAVMAIGMMGLVGMQSSLRSTSDLAKQRSEASRLAQQAIEEWRSFSSIQGNPAALDYTDLAEGVTADAAIVGTNATFTRTRTIASLAAPARGKALTVDVSWPDRTGQTQSVRLTSLIAGIAPDLPLTMAVPSTGDGIGPTKGRNRAIPIDAKDLGDGTSGLMPPTAPTGQVWLFDNKTGVFRICSTSATFQADLLPSNITGCTGSFLAITGFVRYSLSATQPASTAALEPTSSPADLPGYTTPNPLIVSVTESPASGTEFCYAVVDELTVPAYSAYFCAVPVSNMARTVRLSFGPATLLAGATSPDDRSPSRVRVCRYFDLAGSGTYNNPSASVANQNYLVILAGDGTNVFTCPNSGATASHAP